LATNHAKAKSSGKLTELKAAFCRFFLASGYQRANHQLKRLVRGFGGVLALF